MKHLSARQHLALVDKGIRILRDDLEITAEQFLTDARIPDSIEVRLHRVVTSCINVAVAIGIRRKLTPAENYKRAFQVLAESRLISFALKDRMLELVDFRNCTVHVYWDSVPLELFMNLKRYIASIEEFASVASHLIEI